MTGDHSPQAARGWRAYLVLSDDDLLAQCEVDRFRASGPGGQKRNKTDFSVRLRHRLTVLESVAVESRWQHENRA
ncbi:MAG: peptide chain release factor-like protein, partial [Dehalococcoidia bacterium]|nr:peptide chain release factor-like protein [Dehalococcoidia bacterium]